MPVFLKCNDGFQMGPEGPFGPQAVGNLPIKKREVRKKRDPVKCPDLFIFKYLLFLNNN